jgi:uncharacterized damage-inducible protein DinB
MTSSDLLADAFDRIREEVHHAVDGLSKPQLSYRVDGDANSIAWLVWHLTRVQDDHVSEAAGVEQAWTSQGWADRFALPFGRLATGYEHGTDDVAAVQVEAELLTGYHDAVFEQTTRYVRTLSDADLPRVVDESWDPPVTLAVRLVSVISDDLQHVGQAAFVRGVLLNG